MGMVFLTDNRCLEEGAEEFIVKPVKLSDVKRLKDYIMKGDGEKIGGEENRKRKREDIYDHSSLPLPSPSPTCNLSRSTQPTPLPSSPYCPSKRPRLRNRDWLPLRIIYFDRPPPYCILVWVENHSFCIFPFEFYTGIHLHMETWKMRKKVGLRWKA